MDPAANSTAFDQTGNPTSFLPDTRNQVELMQVDNVSSSNIPGFGQLGISPHTVEETLREILQKH
jgi:hypothetical protein